MSYEDRNETDEEIHLRRMKRIEQMKREKKRAEEMRRKILMGAGIGVIALILLLLIIGIFSKGKDKDKEPEKTLIPTESIVTEPVVVATPEPTPAPTPEPAFVPFKPIVTDSTKGFSDAVNSAYGCLIDVEKNTVLAQKDYKVRINPASMTKVLTVLTAAKALGITGEDWQNDPKLKDTFTMLLEITDYSFVNDCSNVGFKVGEVIPVEELFYGTIMPSGADAALGLAYYVAGSQEAFMELMNEELKTLGIAESTHFTNCVGLYDENHYSTVYDIAVIMKAAMDIPFLREVLGTRIHTIPGDEQYPEGIVLSNLFLRRIEDRDTHSEVIGAKTGYVLQSRNCAVSMAKAADGREFICVTAGGESKWKPIYDHTELYAAYIPAAQ